MLIARVWKFAAISLASSLVLISIPAFSASIAGTKCSKAGSTKTASNIKYTCVKQGSKLVWNKGVLVKKAAATASPSPTPSASADSLQTLKTFTPEIGKFYGNLYQEMDKLLINTPSTVKINWFISENASNRSHQKYLKSVEYAARLFEPYFNKSEINIMLFTEKDSTWIDEIQTKLMSSYLINPKQQLQSYRMADGRCGLAGFYLPNNILACTKNDTDLSSVFFASFALAHEYSHLVGMTSKLLTDVQIGDSKRLTPCWVNEGFGQFIGMFAASHIDPNFKTNRNSFFINNPGTVDRTSIDSVINTFKEMERVDDKSGEYCLKGQDAYFMGSVAFEKLTMDYGFAKVMESQKLFYSGKSWADSFKTAFGISTEDFYKEMARIMTTESWLA